MEQSPGEKIFGIAYIVVLGVNALLCLYPFICTLSITRTPLRDYVLPRSL